MIMASPFLLHHGGIGGGGDSGMYLFIFNQLKMKNLIEISLAKLGGGGVKN
jgi:uncharacterized membrane protein